MRNGNKTKILVISLLLLSLVTVPLAACAKPAPAPTPAPAPQPAPAPAPMNIELRTSKTGSQSYLMGSGLADMINAKSTWLRASAVETYGSYDNVKTVGDDPARRKNTIFICTDIPYFEALEGKPPQYEKKYPDMQALLFDMGIGFAFVSDDPNITTKDDFVGKKIAVGSRASSSGLVPEQIFKHGYEILDKVDMKFLGFTEMKDAFMDDLVDAMLAYGIMASDVKWMPSPNMEEPLLLKDKLYFIGVTPEEVDKIKSKTGWAVGKAVMKAGSFGPKQAEDVPVLASRIVWWCYPEFPDEAAYEIARIAHENYKMFADFHASGANISPETMAWLPVVSEDLVAPGAAKYYKEHNIPIRLE